MELSGSLFLSSAVEQITITENSKCHLVGGGEFNGSLDQGHDVIGG